MEARGFSRFIIRQEALIFLPGPKLVGTITDIGLGGVGCQFLLSSWEKATINTDIASTLSAHIFTVDLAYSLSDLRCRLVYDMIVPKDRHFFFKSITRRWCGFKFSQLTRDHEEQLNYFLEKQSAKKALQEKIKTEPENAKPFSNEKWTACIMHL